MVSFLLEKVGSAFFFGVLLCFLIQNDLMRLLSSCEYTFLIDFEVS